MLLAPLIDAHWDGHILYLELCCEAKVNKVVLDLEGTYFSTELVDQKGYTCFRLPFSPSQRNILHAIVRLDRNGIPLVERPLELQMEQPSISYGLSQILPIAPFRKVYESDLLSISVQKTTIIVPIYNAVDMVMRCINSIFKHTSGTVHLVLIDDASTDPAITSLLAQYANIPNITILRNDENLGYTRTINRGITEAGATDVVLLNADTEVGPNWLQGLRRAAYSQRDIGTATAVSDNAGAFSVPELEEHNPLPQQWDFVQTARVCWQQAGLVYPRLPTGNGFCMYIKQVVLAQIGLFDEQGFPQGYGEENDFCMRAAAAGYQHVIAGNVLVRHARSQSFGHERRLALGQAGMAVLRERYPDYEALVGASLFSFERQVLNWRIRRSWCDADGAYATQLPRPRVLFVQNAGAKFLLDPEPALCKEFELWRMGVREDSLLLESYALDWRIEQQQTMCLPSKNSSGAADDELVLCAWLQHYAIELICLNEAGGVLQRLARALEIPCCIESDFQSAPTLVNHLYQAIIATRSFVK